MEVKGTGNFSEMGRWNLLREDVSLPAAVIYQDRLESNIAWMQEFADRHSVMLASHGKTTMAPSLFARQIDTGAWGISVATANQAKVASDHGIRNILLANQLVGRRNMEIIDGIIGKSEFYCLVDSVENAMQPGRFFTASGNQVNVLIEVGIMDGRCGCRNESQVIEVAEASGTFDSLKLAGLEIYEGIVEDSPEAYGMVTREIKKLIMIRARRP